MEQLTDYLLQFGHLNGQQIDLIKKLVFVKPLKKDEYFSEAGKIAKEVAFINTGIVRVVYYDKQGDEITRYFIDESNFVVDLNSFNNSLPSSEYVQAVTDCELVIFSADALNELSGTIIIWDKIIAQITSKALMEKVKRISPMMNIDATTRYKLFLEKFPLMANRIPLSNLASYLGITQSSLSRIRKKL
jgi:CRP-like cAMP-binding protein